MTAVRHVCVHGHFYQPPREHAWLEAVEPQDSAAPYRDWNTRITAECYRPNAAARIVDGAGRITGIIDNYERISFDFGPTLLSWLETEALDVHAAIVDADRRSAVRFGGHGSAMAQAYSHLIMPLASRRDQHTQVRWGIRDFEHRFGRRPEGMWLPECAVSRETLEVLAEQGIAYTVLAPHQAARVRRLGSGDGDWRDVVGGAIDPGRVYRCTLPSGRSIDLFFYDGAVSRAVAFERLLGDGARLAERLRGGGGGGGGGDGDGDLPTLSHIATDGESYGHHHRFGDMALAWALEHLDAERARGAPVRLTNYGEFRALHPARDEVEIVEHTAWSCAHGVGRWFEDCGCSTGGHPSWNQAWRRPLRDALDWLRDRTADVYEAAAPALLRDPWAARDAYVDVILARAGGRGEPEAAHNALTAFFSDHAAAPLDDDGQRRALELLEMQRHAMLMYTSCGWFFDDLAGIETVQVLQYAARAIELAERHVTAPIEPTFVDRLSHAHSNLARHGDGRALWAAQVRPARVDLRQVVAHHAVSSLFQPSADLTGPERVYCYDLVPGEVVARHAGKARLIAGAVRARSRITGEHAELSFAALHLGEHHLVGGVRTYPGAEAHARMVAALTEAFAGADLFAAQRLLDQHLPELSFSLRSLFKSERDRVLERILATSLAEAEAAYLRLYDHHAPLLRYLTSIEVPLPGAFHTAARFVLEHRLHRALAAEPPRLVEIAACLEEAAGVRVELDLPAQAFAWTEALRRMVDRLARDPDDLDQLERTADLAELAARRHVELDLWHAENACWSLRAQREPAWRALAATGDAAAARRVAGFARLCAAVNLAPTAAAS